MVFPTFFGEPGWKLLSPIVGQLNKAGVGVDEIDVNLKKCTLDQAKDPNFKRAIAVMACKGSTIGIGTTGCIIGMF